MDVVAFQRKWIDASQQKECSAYVTHFNLCHLLGVPKPHDAELTWMENAFATFDHAVWDAYGRPSNAGPADVEEDVILSRLIALKGERAGEG